MDVSEQITFCPYCGEYITILIDGTIDQQEYVEDCEVCCSPIIINVEISHNEDIFINTRKENE